MTEPEELVEQLAAWQECRDRGDDEGARRLLEEHPSLRPHVLAAQLLPHGFRDAPRSQAPRESGVPETVGDFRIVREIGRGGMGVVYEAEQISLRRRVALKILSLTIGSNPQAIKRFEREARAAAKLHHTNIVPIHAMGQHQGHWYYAMELVEGRPLGDVVKELSAEHGAPESTHDDASAGQQPGLSTGGSIAHSPSWYGELAGMFAGVAEALDLAHKEGIVHRDIKPANLLLDADGILKIVDFGLAMQPDDSMPAMTVTGQLIGTPRYMSPEQARAHRAGIDHRTDVYSLGATLYELLTLQPPFDGETLQDLCSQIITKDPALPRRIDHRVPRDLETVVLKAMEKDPARRYATAADFARDLRACAEGGAVSARRVGPVGRAWRKIKRHKVRSALAAGVLVLAGLGAWLALRAHDEGSRRRQLEYDRLIAQAQHASGFRLGRERGQHADDAGAEQAQRLLDEAIALVPERPEAWWLRALAGSDVEDLDEAGRHGLSRRTLHLSRAFLLTRQQRHEEAERERALAEQAGRGSPADDYFEARLRYADGRRAEAMQLLDRAIRENGRDSSVRYLALRHRAALLLGEERYESALEDLSRLLDRGDTSIPVRIQIASAWRHLGQEETAEARLATLIAELGEQPDVRPWLELHQACHATWQNDWSMRVTSAALEQHPEDTQLLKARMWALLRVDRAREGGAIARRLVRLDPEAHGAWEGLGEALIDLREFAEARKALARAVELDPGCAEAWRAQGHLLLEMNELDGALEAYSRAIDCKRDFDHAWVQKGVVLQRLGRPDEALAAYEHALKLDPSNPSAYINRGSLFADVLAEYEAAIVDFRKAVELAPQEVEAHRNLAVVLSRLGRVADAAAAFAAAIALAPHVAEPQVTRWRLLRKLGRDAELERELETIVAAHADEPAFQHVRGHAFLELDRFAEAAACYEKAIEHEGETRCLLLDTAEAQRHLGAYDLALEAYERLLQRGPDADVLQERAKTWQVMGAKDKALTGYGEVLALDPDHRDALLLRAGLRLDGGDARGALEDLEELLALDAEHAHGWRVRGLALRRLRDFKGAEQALLRAYDLAPTDAQVLVALGAFVCDVKHELNRALELLEEAVRQDPSSRDALVFRASVLGGLGRPREAIEAWNEALKHHPKEFRAHRQLGRLLSTTGEHEKAVRSHEAACALRPNDAGAHYTRGSALYQAGRSDEAVEALRRALELRPGNVAVLRTLGAFLLEAGKHQDVVDLPTSKVSEPVLLFQRAIALFALDRKDEALAVYEAAAGLAAARTKPDDLAEMFHHAAAEALGIER